MIEKVNRIWREENYERGEEAEHNKRTAKSAGKAGARMYKSAYIKTHTRLVNAKIQYVSKANLSGNKIVAKRSRKNKRSLESTEIKKLARSTPSRNNAPSDSNVPSFVNQNCKRFTAEEWICVYSMDNRTIIRTYVQDNRDTIKEQTNQPDSQGGRIYIWGSDTYFKRETNGIGIQASQETAGSAKKRALKSKVRYRLCFEDEAGFNLHPYLARMWHRRGCQPRIPAPGQNHKQYVFGAIDYKTGKFFSHVQDTNNQWGCLVIVQKLVMWAKHTRTPVILAWDNARTHTAKRLQTYLGQPSVKQWLKIFWISRYSPDLNEIERLWKYLKQTGVANHLFRNIAEFRTHLLKLLSKVNNKPYKATGIVFKMLKNAANQ